MQGIDVHGDKGPINWRAVKDAGYSFAYVKCTEGATFTDARYTTNVRNARRAGIKVGSYHFARPDNNTAEAETQHFLARLDLKAGDLLPALDFEHVPYSAAWALRFLKQIESHIGEAPVFYSYPNFIANMKPGPAIGKYPLWFASYRSTPPQAPHPWDRVSIWQRSSRGHVPGVPGFCDMNTLMLPRIDPLLYGPAPVKPRAWYAKYPRLARLPEFYVALREYARRLK